MKSKPAHERLFLALALVRGKEKVAWGNILVKPTEGYTWFGALMDAELPNPQGGHPWVIQLTAGLLIVHSTDALGAKLMMKLFDVEASADRQEPLVQVLRFTSATRIPAGYNSEKEDSMVLLDEYRLVFRATWLPS